MENTSEIFFSEGQHRLFGENIPKEKDPTHNKHVLGAQYADFRVMALI